MKKLLSMLLAMLMLAAPVLSLAEAPQEDNGLAIYDAVLQRNAYVPLLNELGLLPGVDLSYYTIFSDALAADRAIVNSMTFSGGEGLVSAMMGSGDDTAEYAAEYAAVDQAIADMLSALSMRVNMLPGEISGALSLNGKEVLNIGYGEKGTDTYVMSNLLGGSVVIGEVDLVPLLERIIGFAAQFGLLGEEDASISREELEQIVDTAKAMMVSALAQYSFDASVLEGLDVTAVTDVLNPIFQRAQTAGAVQPDDCDPAVTCTTVTVTPAEAKGFIKGLLLVIRNNPALADAVAEATGYGEDSPMVIAYSQWREEPFSFAEHVLDPAIASLEEADLNEIINGDAVISLWQAADGTPVKLDARFPYLEVPPSEWDYVETVDEEGNPAYEWVETPGGDPIQREAAVVVTRLTTEDVQTWQLSASAAEDAFHARLDNAPTALTIALDAVSGGVSTMDMRCGMDITQADNRTRQAFDVEYTVGSGEYAMKFAVDGTAEYVIDGVDFTAAEIMNIAVNDVAVMTVDIRCATEDAVPMVVTEDAVRLMDFDETAFSNWCLRLISDAQAWVGTLLQSLPESVLALFMGAAQ